MFWGLIMESNKRYTQVVEKPFHISQAAMDTSTGDSEPCQVMVVVDGKNFLICTLQKNKSIQVPLDLYFKTGDSISFLTNGKCNIHLSGYLDPEFEDDLEDEEDDEDEEEIPTLVSAKNKRKLENTTENATKKTKIDKKAGKKPAAADSSDSDDEEGKNQLQKILDGEDIDTDEDDESFKVNTSAEQDSDEEESDDDEEGGEEEDDDDDEEEDEEQEGASTSEAETTLDTSKEEAKVDTSKLTKSQKRRLKKKLAQQAKEPQVNGVDKAKKEKPEVKADKKKGEAKKDVQEPVEKKEKKSLTGGVSIEDTKVGSGPVAKPGKVVMVYYEGRLKSNNKMFDNCVKGPGFKFRLGAKEVITGWDVGINGMKVGGKRRVTCPPAMAYGAKGSPPVIPPNSTLVFDVELKNVK